MKLSFLAIAASVQATFIPGGKAPKTGHRVRHMWTASDQMQKHTEGKYGFSGDLISADFMGMGNGFAEDGSPDLIGQQGQRDETWFYYQSPFKDAWQNQGDYPWYRVIYTPWFAGPASATGVPFDTINGTEVYTITDCSDAVRALYENNDDAQEQTLKDDCELKCVLFTEDTDWFNKRNCSDPAGSLKMGSKGSGHPWLQPLYDFEDEVAEKIQNGEETNLIFDFVPPHVVGSKIMAPDAQDDVNQTQIENNQQLNHDNNPHLFGENMTVTVHGDDIETDVDEPDVTTTVAPTTTAAVAEDSGFLINSVSISLLLAMTIFN